VSAVFVVRILKLEVSFYLPGCQSLKEKRQRLGGMADKLGRVHQIALCESGQQDNWQQSLWTFVIAANTTALADQHCAQIETTCLELDASILNIAREWLS
jgi:uncharacterized protein